MKLTDSINCYQLNPGTLEWDLTQELLNIPPIPHNVGNMSIGQEAIVNGRVNPNCHLHYNAEKGILYFHSRYKGVLNISDLIKKSESFPEEGVYLFVEGIMENHSFFFQKIREVRLLPYVIDVEEKEKPVPKKLNN